MKNTAVWKVVWLRFIWKFSSRGIVNRKLIVIISHASNAYWLQATTMGVMLLLSLVEWK